jgi:hypothetical protein
MLHVRSNGEEVIISAKDLLTAANNAERKKNTAETSYCTVLQARFHAIIGINIFLSDSRGTVESSYLPNPNII